MNKEEKSAFIELLSGIAEVFNKSLSAVGFEIYWEALKSYPLADIKRAINAVVSCNRYAVFPKPAEFLEFINPPEDINYKAELAYQEFEKAYCEIGDYESFSFIDPIVGMVCKRFGGWKAIFDAFPRYGEDFARQQFKREFIVLYKGMANNPLPKGTDLRMIGTFETGNKIKGYLTQPNGNPIIGNDGIALIGDAKQVYNQPARLGEVFKKLGK